MARRNIIHLACDSSRRTGESMLIPPGVVVYQDFVVKCFSRSLFLRDRVLPLYLYCLSVANLVIGRNVCFINYTPFWAFWLVLLFRVKKFSVIKWTGSTLDYSHINFFRGFILNILLRLSFLVAPKDKEYIVSTFSLYNDLKKRGFNVKREAPYVSLLNNLSSIPTRTSVSPSVLIYTYKHWLKGNDTLISAINIFLMLEYVVHLVGDINSSSIKNPNFFHYARMSQSEFKILQNTCGIYYSHTYEEGGISAIEMLKLGKCVILRKGYGIYNEFSQYPYAYSNNDDLFFLLSNLKGSNVANCWPYFSMQIQ